MSEPSEIQLRVQGMTCQHCVKAVTAAVLTQDPQAQIQIDLASGTVKALTVLPATALQGLIEDEGYTVVG